MLSSLRLRIALYKARFARIFSGFDMDTLEVVNCACLGWQAYRFAILAGFLLSPFVRLPLAPGHAQNAAGSELSSAVAGFWGAIFGANLSHVALALVIATLSGVIALLEEKTLLRLVLMFFETAWWAWEASMLTIHTPLHDGGGVYFLFMAFSTGSVVLLAVKWDEQHDFAAVKRLLTLRHKWRGIWKRRGRNFWQEKKLAGEKAAH